MIKRHVRLPGNQIRGHRRAIGAFKFIKEIAKEQPRHGVALHNNPVVNVGSCHGMTS
jgi:hypothetical protein